MLPDPRIEIETKIDREKLRRNTDRYRKLDNFGRKKDRKLSNS